MIGQSMRFDSAACRVPPPKAACAAKTQNSTCDIPLTKLDTIAWVQNATGTLPHRKTTTFLSSRALRPHINCLKMIRISNNLAAWALWALLAFASAASFAAASGDSSSEDAGGGGNASSSEDNDDALGNNRSTEYFSVPAFFITFRETIEVCFVVPRDGVWFSRWLSVVVVWWLSQVQGHVRVREHATFWLRSHSSIVS